MDSSPAGPMASTSSWSWCGWTSVSTTSCGSSSNSSTATASYAFADPSGNLSRGKRHFNERDFSMAERRRIYCILTVVCIIWVTAGMSLNYVYAHTEQSLEALELNDWDTSTQPIVVGAHIVRLNNLPAGFFGEFLPFLIYLNQFLTNFDRFWGILANFYEFWLFLWWIFCLFLRILAKFVGNSTNFFKAWRFV